MLSLLEKSASVRRSVGAVGAAAFAANNGVSASSCGSSSDSSIMGCSTRRASSSSTMLSAVVSSFVSTMVSLVDSAVLSSVGSGSRSTSSSTSDSTVFGAIGSDTSSAMTADGTMPDSMAIASSPAINRFFHSKFSAFMYSQPFPLWRFPVSRLFAAQPAASVLSSVLELEASNVTFTRLSSCFQGSSPSLNTASNFSRSLI